MKYAALLPLALLPLLAACPADPTCAEGLGLDEGGACVPLAPEGCDGDGELAVPGEDSCRSIGWTECGAAFSPDDKAGCTDLCRDGDVRSCRVAGRIPCADGFVPADLGCSAVVATETCAGATRPALGAEACVPVGDCDAPFPPAGATLFVDDTFADGELDAAHHRSIVGALAVAASGDVIAVESGTYRERVVVPSGVELAGRCAAQVVIEGPDDLGIGVSDDVGVVVRGVTVRGFDIGVQVDYAATATFEDVIVEDNDTVGMFVLDSGTEVTMRRSVIRDPAGIAGRFGTGIGVGFGGALTLEDSAVERSLDMGLLVDDAGSQATVSRSIVAGTQGRGNDTLGWGLVAQGGGAITLIDSLVRGNRNVGVNAVGSGSSLVVRGSVVEDTVVGADVPGGGNAFGVSAQLSAALEIEDTTVRRSALYGVRVGEEGTSATLRGLVVDGVAPEPVDGLSVGLLVENGAAATLVESFVRNEASLAGPTSFGAAAASGATLTLEDVTVAEVPGAGVASDGAGSLVEARRVLVRDGGVPGGDFGHGVSVSAGARFVADGLGLVGDQSSALFVDDAEASVARATVRGTRPGAAGRGRAVNAQFAAVVDIEASRLEDNVQVGVFAYGAGTEVTLTHSAVRRTAPTPDGQHGAGAQVLDGAQLFTDGVELKQSAGVGALFANAAGVLVRTRVLDNRVGLHAQDGTEIREQADAPKQADALTVVVSASEFSGNDTRVGSGSLAVPEPAPSAFE